MSGATPMEWVFWISLAVAAYTYVGYPLLLALIGMLRMKPRAIEPFAGSFSFVLSLHNEEANVKRRLDELTALVRATGLDGEILLVSDGSTDGTVEAARAFETEGIVRVLDRPQKEGKSAALSAGCAVARGDILVFADARQRWADDAVSRLLENFADPRVGAVSGDLVLESAPGVMAGVGLYWRFEKWLRKKESQIHAQVGVTGAISACRRVLFRPIPLGTLLDDVYWPLCVAMQGYRVVHDERAKAYDRLPERPRDEFRRKVRTLAGNFQLVRLLPASLLPWRNPVWLQWISRKLLRLLVPWALLAMLITNIAIVAGDPPSWLTASEPGEWRSEWFFPGFLMLQAVGYALGLLGMVPAVARRVKPAGAAASLLVLNAAAFLAFWVWITGRTGKAWHKIDYRPKEV